MLKSILITFTLINSILSASYSPTLDLNNSTQLTAAAAKALQNLIGYYVPGDVSFKFSSQSISSI